MSKPREVGSSLLSKDDGTLPHVSESQSFCYSSDQAFNILIVWLATYMRPLPQETMRSWTGGWNK